MSTIDPFKEYLSPTETKAVESTPIDSTEGLIKLLLKRVPADNIKELVTILKLALSSSLTFDDENDKEKSKLIRDLEENPSLLLNEKIQKKLEEFIKNKLKKEKQALLEKTSEISSFIGTMEDHLKSAISSSDKGTKNVGTIKEKIELVKIDGNNVQKLEEVQKELITAAESIETEMNEVTSKLKDGNSKVVELEEKVKFLEEELTKTKEESMRDHLTGLLTRRAFEDELKKVEASYQRSKHDFAVVFFDIDYFKKVNDTYGHEGGDIILSTFAKILEKSCRTHDVVGRYGGEEFIAIIHYKSADELIPFLKRIKDIVTLHSFRYRDKRIKISFSAGVTLRCEHDTYDSAIQKSDLLLYEAKENGRNQIRLEDGKVI